VSTLDNFAALQVAADRAGLSTAGVEIIKIGDNALYRLPNHIVARVSRPGRTSAAFKEIAVARWLERLEVPAVHALDRINQPIRVEDRCITFWHELPPHRSATTRQIAAVLRVLHTAPPPDDFLLPVLNPFVGLTERLDAACSLNRSEHSWLVQRIQVLRETYERFSYDRDRTRVVHGDAHDGNIVTVDGGSVVLLDLEWAAVGPPEWDLVSIAVENDSATWCPDDDYAEFVEGYGEDVRDWPHYEMIRGIHELRMTCYVAELSNDQPAAREETTFRIDCLRGVHGARPWPWKAM